MTSDGQNDDLRHVVCKLQEQCRHLFNVFYNFYHLCALLSLKLKYWIYQYFQIGPRKYLSYGAVLV